MKIKDLFFALAATALFTTAQAQVKVGANPGTITPNATFDVEGTSGAHSVILQNGNMGVGTTTPQNTLHVNGTTQLSGALQTGGTTSTSGNAGTTGQVLLSQGPGSAPVWSNLGTSGAAGTISGVYQVIGTSSVTIAQGGSAIIPGTTLTITTATANTLVLITVTGYGVPAAGKSVQGSLDILIDGAKVTSGYYDGAGQFVGTGNGTLANMPAPTTLQYVATITGVGTHIISIQARSWFENTVFNQDAYPSYAGSQPSDANALKTRVSAILFAQ